MSRKYFTLQQANTLIPMVKQELTTLQELKREYFEKYYELKILKSKQGIQESDVFTLECQLEFLEMDAELHVKNITTEGIELKDIDHGLIDFPSRINGQDVLLCWKQGEDQIRFYHGTNEGFAGRKRIVPGQFESLS